MSAWDYNMDALQIQPSPDIAPLFFHRSLWQYIEGDPKWKYCITGDFCSLTFMGTE